MNRTLLFIALAVLLVGAVLVPVAAATGDGQFSLDWWTVTGGGGLSSAGPYTLAGSSGQPIAATGLSGGDFSLAGGFWAGSPESPATPRSLYLPLVANGTSGRSASPSSEAQSSGGRIYLPAIRR